MMSQRRTFREIPYPSRVVFTPEGGVTSGVCVYGGAGNHPSRRQNFGKAFPVYFFGDFQFETGGGRGAGLPKKILCTPSSHPLQRSVFFFQHEQFF